MHSQTNDTLLGSPRSAAAAGETSPTAGHSRAGVAKLISHYRGAATRGRPALTWVALGFLSGALFWHVVGFWGFVSGVVLNTDGQTATWSRPTTLASKISLATTSPEQRSCSQAVRVRDGDTALLEPCSDRWTPILALGHRDRQDKLGVGETAPNPENSETMTVNEDEAGLSLTWDARVAP